MENKSMKTLINTLLIAAIMVGVVMMAIGICLYYMDMDCKAICRNAEEGHSPEYPYHEVTLSFKCMCGRAGIYGEEWVRGW